MRYFYIFIVGLLCSIFKIKRRELKWEDYFGDWKETPYISPLPKMLYHEREVSKGSACCSYYNQTQILKRKPK